MQDRNSLFSCFSAFSEKKVLRGNDVWYCSQCKDFREAVCDRWLWTTPELLDIHLKRVNKSENIQHFPITGLNLSSLVLSEEQKHEVIYDLYAVCTRATDHCTAVVKSLENERWYQLDDSRVSKVQVDDGASYLAVFGYFRRIETNTVMPMGIIDIVDDDDDWI